jgi:hypothetical protein
MGVEQEDSDPSSSVPTDPGIGRTAGVAPAGHAPPMPERRGASNGVRPPPPSGRARAAAAPVDFDALHAALGAPPAPDEPRRRAASRPAIDEAPTPAAPRVGESKGEHSARYASARPHRLPPIHVPAERPDIPAVIVTSDDTVPSGAPQMTVPMGAPVGGAPVGGAPASGPHPAASPQYPYTPQPFPTQPVARAAANPTVRMDQRPRRPRVQTVVVRSRGPSALQKALAFIAMLVLVTACGIAVIVWRQPTWIGLAPRAAEPEVTPVPTGVTLVEPSGVAPVPSAAAEPVAREPEPSAPAAPAAKPRSKPKHAPR